MRTSLHVGDVSVLRDAVDDVLCRFPKCEVPSYLLRCGGTRSSGSVLNPPEGLIGSLSNLVSGTGDELPGMGVGV